MQEREPADRLAICFGMADQYLLKPGAVAHLRRAACSHSQPWSCAPVIAGTENRGDWTFSRPSRVTAETEPTSCPAFEPSVAPENGNVVRGTGTAKPIS
jgi:hypothetical protein